MSRVSFACLLVAAFGCGRIGYDEVDRRADAMMDGVLPGEDAPMCVSDPCTLVLPQCGCATGQMCQRTGATTEERSCIQAGTIAADNTCTLDAQCVPGHACLSSGGSSGTCHRYCAGDTDCAPGLACAKYDEGVNIGVCGATCTLEGGCGGDNVCKVVLVFDFDTTGPVALPVCVAPGGTNAGSSCGSSLDCAAGLFCHASVCRPMCRQDGSLTCPTGTCQSADAPIYLGNVEHGVCR